MNVWGLSRAIGIGAATAILAGCGGQTPLGSTWSMPQTTAKSTRAHDLLYVSNAWDVTVYSYPEGKLEATVGSFYGTNGECADKAGDVFVLNDVGGRIYEYAHGASRPALVLDTPAGPATSCAIDPATGNLAATSGNTVEVYRAARGRPKEYADRRFDSFAFCGYDERGNLFVDGKNLSAQFAFVELAAGASKFTQIESSQKIEEPGDVQWDGRRVVVGDLGRPVLYEFSVENNKATKVGTIHLGTRARAVRQFEILGKLLVAPVARFNRRERPFFSAVLYYEYPQGGTATGEVHRGVHAASGAVVSFAQPSP